MTGQPQPNRASSLPADSVYSLEHGRLTAIADRRLGAPPKPARPALSLVKSSPAGKPSLTGQTVRIIDEAAKPPFLSDTDKENHDV